MAASVKLKELEEFINRNDPFTKTLMMQELGISRETADKSVLQLLNLGVVRLLSIEGNTRHYTKSPENRPAAGIDTTGERQLEFLREIAKSPEQMAQLFGAREYSEKIKEVSATLDRASANPMVKLAIVYALERKLVKKIRSTRK